MTRKTSKIDIDLLADREAKLYGKDVEITHKKEVYWPIRVVETAAELLISPELHKALKLIIAGYNNRDLLERRFPSDELDKHLQELAKLGLVQTTEDEEYIANSSANVRSDSGNLPERAPIEYYDAVSDFEIQLPEEVEMDSHSNRVKKIPVLAYPPIDKNDGNVRFLRCAIILMKPKTGYGLEIRVIYKYERVNPLEDLLYDLLIDDSPRLAASGLTVPRRPPSVEDEDVAPPEPKPTVEPTHKKPKSTPTAASISARKSAPEIAKKPEAKTQPKPVSTPLPAGQLEVIRGKDMHQDVLFRALSEATDTVAIVTPFIRSMLDNTKFIYSMKRAVERGVIIVVIHGMPESHNQYEDAAEKQRENSRIRKTQSQVNRPGKMKLLQFYRVTHPNKSKADWGDHSKILICDQKWAVISSYNWLSIPEFRDETGVLIYDQKVISELLAMYKKYIDRPSEESNG